MQQRSSADLIASHVSNPTVLSVEVMGSCCLCAVPLTSASGASEGAVDRLPLESSKRWAPQHQITQITIKMLKFLLDFKPELCYTTDELLRHFWLNAAQGLGYFSQGWSRSLSGV